MSEKDEAYYHGTGPKFRLDDHGNMIPIKPDPVITPKQPAVMEMPPVPEVIAETRPVIDEALENGTEELTEEILEHIYAGDYKKAYGLAQSEGVDISGHIGLFAVLEDEMRQIFVEGGKKPTEKYLKLLYLLGGNANLDTLPGLKDFILLVFNHYRDKCWPKSGPKPLKRLIRLFGDQIDFGDVEDYI